MKREKKRMGISLRVFIIVHVMIVCAIVMILYSFMSKRVYMNRYQEQLESNVVAQCNSLAFDLKRNQMSVTTPTDLSLKIDTVASAMYGRVIVIDRDYRIIIDTYGKEEGTYLLNETVMKVMTGEQKPEILRAEDYLQYMTLVTLDGETIGAVILQASTESIQTVDDRSERRNLFIFSLLMLLCLVMAVLIGNSSVSGIKKINRQMEIAGDGHFDTPIPVKGFREFKQLTESYNDTISKLVTIDSTRQEFVSNVSHELKTPITSMKVLADSLIQNEEADLAMYKEFMTDIVDEIDRESKIITDLLTLVKMDKKSAEMNIEEISINELLEIILKRVTPIAKSRGIEITYESYRDVTAAVDEVKLSLALTNIIENAVKYNVDNGWVKVSLNADHKYFYIKVADSGVGIPDDCKEQVFERFYRVDKARSRDTGGTGLGLAITKSVIQMHEGSIKLYSESGEGTTFTIKIPIKMS